MFDQPLPATASFCTRHKETEKEKRKKKGDDGRKEKGKD
jgi:hypothetical protein